MEPQGLTPCSGPVMVSCEGLPASSSLLWAPSVHTLPTSQLEKLRLRPSDVPEAQIPVHSCSDKNHGVILRVPWWPSGQKSGFRGWGLGFRVPAWGTEI